MILDAPDAGQVNQALYPSPMSIERVGFACVVGVLFVVGCSADISAPQPGPPPKAAQLALTAENAFRCSVVSEDARASDTGGYRLDNISIPASPALRADSSPLGLYAFYRIDPDGFSLLMHANCVLPQNDVASRYAQIFLGRSGQRIRGATLSWVGTISCWYDPAYDETECNGELCTRWATGNLTGGKANTSIGDTFMCDNGCTIYGTSGYSCPDGGGGDIDGGDSGGGGGGGGGSDPYSGNEPTLDENCPSCVVDTLSTALKQQFSGEADRLKANRNPADECYLLGDAIANGLGSIRTTALMWSVGGALVGGDAHQVEPEPGYGKVHIALAIPTNVPPDFAQPRSADDLNEEVRHEFAHLPPFNLPQGATPDLDPARAMAARCR